MGNKIVINRLDDSPITIELNGKIIYKREAKLENKLDTPENIEAYKAGYVAALDLKQGFKFTLFGLDVEEALGVLAEYTMKKYQGNNK